MMMLTGGKDALTIALEGDKNAERNWKQAMQKREAAGKELREYVLKGAKDTTSIAIFEADIARYERAEEAARKVYDEESKFVQELLAKKQEQELSSEQARLSQHEEHASVCCNSVLVIRSLLNRIQARQGLQPNLSNHLAKTLHLGSQVYHLSANGSELYLIHLATHPLSCHIPRGRLFLCKRKGRLPCPNLRRLREVLQAKNRDSVLSCLQGSAFSHQGNFAPSRISTRFFAVL